jgi:hypothetical protein
MALYGPSPLLVHFTGGDAGGWQVTDIKNVIGEPLSAVRRVSVHEGVARHRLARGHSKAWPGTCAIRHDGNWSR